ncbi:MAG TPA: hypothetical protein PKY59_14275 [Pyrinomonadaceae bacterium]|nr:hypothetical protein [Pyrinomonadaceae bacterium]
MPQRFFRKIFWINTLYDWLFEVWEGNRSQRWQANLLVCVFLFAISAIELSRQGFLPSSWHLPTNHFHAVKLAFELLLLLEVMGLVFNLADSVANAMGKQFEIFSLILLRQSFKEFVNFAEPIEWSHVGDSVKFILSDALGGLIIFGLLGVFYYLQKHRRITDNDEELASFILAKKILALTLLATFILIGLFDAWLWFANRQIFKFFEVFYTILVFSDILLVLISLRYNSTYSIVFRNSGFAVATILLRLALTAPPFINVSLGVAAIGLSIGLTYIYNNFKLFPPHSEITHGISEAGD